MDSSQLSSDHELRLNPRAMRLFAGDLAATMVAVAWDAKQDLERQLLADYSRAFRRRRTARACVLTDPLAAQAKLAELGELASSTA